MNHGETLRKIRTLKGFSQDYVASKLGIKQTSYSQWEHKEVISDEKLLILFKILEIKKEDFENYMNDFIMSKLDKTEDNLFVNSIVKLITEQTALINRMVELLSIEKKNK